MNIPFGLLFRDQNQSYNNIHTSLERPFNYLLNVI